MSSESSVNQNTHICSNLGEAINTFTIMSFGLLIIIIIIITFSQRRSQPKAASVDSKSAVAAGAVPAAGNPSYAVQ